MTEPILIEKENYVVNTYGNKFILFIKCPKCSRCSQLENHTIADNGDVLPIMFCEYNCGFHDYVKLNSWRNK